jgi:hypothetical protein
MTSENFSLGTVLPERHTGPRWNRRKQMMREMQLLTVGFILAFLGAIVVGIF